MVQRRILAPNGEVEGPSRSAQAMRAHTVSRRPRRVTTTRSRTPPTIVRRQHREMRASTSGRSVPQAPLRLQRESRLGDPGIGKMTNHSPELYGNRDPGYQGGKAHPSERRVVWPPGA